MSVSMQVDESFCGKLSLNKTNMIQPHGFLLIASVRDSIILQVSENSSSLLNLPLEQIPGASLKELISEADWNLLTEKLTSNTGFSIPFLISFPAGKYLSIVRIQDELIMIEVDKSHNCQQRSDEFFTAFQNIRLFSAAIENIETVKELCNTAAKELKRISGFDKVMVYRFDQYWNGDVISEVMEEEMESYLGLKFPATDIPRQARELYQKMPYRLISNIDYQPVKLFPVLNSLTGTFTDLSGINLRSVAAVHLEYLKNMQVAASMSTRIIYNNSLWGLIACHHRKPKYLSFEECSLFEIASSIFSARMAAIQFREQGAYKEEKLELQNVILKTLYTHHSLMHAAGDLLKFLNVDGLALITGSEIRRVGLSPTNAELEELVFWLRSTNIQKTFAEAALPEKFEAASAFDNRLFGLLALPLRPEKNQYLLGFRQEAIQKLCWSGNPSESLQIAPDGQHYHPRSSFRIWQQTVTGRSLDWSSGELESAEMFRNSIVEYLLNKTEI